jgi:anion-transporting  ArsA/GET3 family ATPase
LTGLCFAPYGATRVRGTNGLRHRLFIVSGKGGVGKSAISAALALGFSSRNEKTLVCEVNTQERITQLLEKPQVGPEVTQVEQNLWSVDVRPAEAMREYALMALRSKTLYRAVFESRPVRYFLRFLPSLQELVVLGKILHHVQEKNADGTYRFDRIVMDAPATGHTVTFLNVPKVLLDHIPPGPMRTQAEWMHGLLTDPIVTLPLLVSLPEEMPVNETLELQKMLERDLRLPPAASAHCAQQFCQ